MANIAAGIDNNQGKEVAVLWSIKGYHFFKIRPHEEIPLLVLPEDGNVFDEHAMMVVMPKNVAEEMLEAVTRKGDAKRKTQKVKDILGKQVGRVPANLCRIFRELLQTDMLLENITCYHSITVGHSISPHFQKVFKRARARLGRDEPGGGAELKCSYFLRIKDTCYDQAVERFKKRLPEEDFEQILF